VVANQDEVRQLADACVVVSTKTRDVDAAAKLLQIAIRVLRVADPVLPPDADLDIAAFTHSKCSAPRKACLRANLRRSFRWGTLCEHVGNRLRRVRAAVGRAVSLTTQFGGDVTQRHARMLFP
jgi:hypothetical protein